MDGRNRPVQHQHVAGAIQWYKLGPVVYFFFRRDRQFHSGQKKMS